MPGGIEPPLSKTFQIPQGANSELVKALMPFGKPNLAAPEHIAGTIAFLVSDDAFFINGTEISVDGGKI